MESAIRQQPTLVPLKGTASTALRPTAGGTRRQACNGPTAAQAPQGGPPSPTTMSEMDSHSSTTSSDRHCMHGDGPGMPVGEADEELYFSPTNGGPAAGSGASGNCGTKNGADVDFATIFWRFANPK